MDKNKKLNMTHIQSFFDENKDAKYLLIKSKLSYSKTYSYALRIYRNCIHLLDKTDISKFKILYYYGKTEISINDKTFGKEGIKKLDIKLARISQDIKNNKTDIKIKEKETKKTKTENISTLKNPQTEAFYKQQLNLVQLTQKELKMVSGGGGGGLIRQPRTQGLRHRRGAIVGGTSLVKPGDQSSTQLHRSAADMLQGIRDSIHATLAPVEHADTQPLDIADIKPGELPDIQEIAEPPSQIEAHAEEFPVTADIAPTGEDERAPLLDKKPPKLKPKPSRLRQFFTFHPLRSIKNTGRMFAELFRSKPKDVERSHKLTPGYVSKPIHSTAQIAGQAGAKALSTAAGLGYGVIKTGTSGYRLYATLADTNANINTFNPSIMTDLLGSEEDMHAFHSHLKDAKFLKTPSKLRRGMRRLFHSAQKFEMVDKSEVRTPSEARTKIKAALQETLGNKFEALTTTEQTVLLNQVCESFGFAPTVPDEYEKASSSAPEGEQQKALAETVLTESELKLLLPKSAKKVKGDGLLTPRGRLKAHKTRKDVMTYIQNELQVKVDRGLLTKNEAKMKAATIARKLGFADPQQFNGFGAKAPELLTSLCTRGILSETGMFVKPPSSTTLRLVYLDMLQTEHPEQEKADLLKNMDEAKFQAFASKIKKALPPKPGVQKTSRRALSVKQKAAIFSGNMISGTGFIVSGAAKLAGAVATSASVVTGATVGAGVGAVVAFSRSSINASEWRHEQDDIELLEQMRTQNQEDGEELEQELTFLRQKSLEHAAKSTKFKCYGTAALCVCASFLFPPAAPGLIPTAIGLGATGFGAGLRG